jgi:ubiquitin-like protein Pup
LTAVTQARPTRKQRRAQAEEEKHPSTGVDVEILDALLDDIDEILETNEVVRLFVQKPGE